MFPDTRTLSFYIQLKANGGARTVDKAFFRRRYAIGQFVDQSGDVISHLNISNVRVEDGGLYSCRATNSLGSTEHSARLNIYGNVLFMTVEYSNP